MRILAELTAAAVFVAMSGMPAIAECGWGKVAQSAPVTVSQTDETARSALATNDLGLEAIRAGEATPEPAKRPAADQGVTP